MKNYYFAVTIEENGKYYAYAVKATENDNILCKLKIKNIKCANICPTKKRAAEVVEAWNCKHWKLMLLCRVAIFQEFFS